MYAEQDSHFIEVNGSSDVKAEDVSRPKRAAERFHTTEEIFGCRRRQVVPAEADAKVCEEGDCDRPHLEEQQQTDAGAVTDDCARAAGSQGPEASA